MLRAELITMEKRAALHVFPIGAAAKQKLRRFCLRRKRYLLLP
jgi:hypothetical protein